MAFTRETPRTPLAIADIAITLFDPDPTGAEPPAASYSVQVRFSDGSINVLTGDLVPHVTTTQINQLLAFMASLRVKAVAEILP